MPKGEIELIRRIRDLLPPSWRTPVPADGRGPSRPGVPFGDDMSAFATPSAETLWTTDIITEGVDFLPARHDWHSIGWKAMAVNLSDVASMAAHPLAALVGVVLNDKLSLEDAVALHRGMIDCAARYNCPITGGDTNSWPQGTIVAVTIAAQMSPGLSPVTRSGARPGDMIFVSGRLGGSILKRHIHPVPRLDIAESIARTLSPTAMIDISDGLSRDLGHILESSNCGAILDESRLHLAIHADAEALSARDAVPALDHALHDGEDFELIITLPGNTVASSRTAIDALGLIEIGVIQPPGQFSLRAVDGALRPIEPRGWEHFR